MANIRQIEKKRSIVLTAGVFDLLHLGHVKFLKEAKKAGGKHAELIVVIARDKTVEKRKGAKPVMSENQRRALVESLRVVDKAILGYEQFSISKIIEKIKPDVIALGHDQTGIGEKVKRAIVNKGVKMKVIRIGKFSEDELDSSSEIKRKITELYKQ